MSSEDYPAHIFGVKSAQEMELHVYDIAQDIIGYIRQYGRPGKLYTREQFAQWFAPFAALSEFRQADALSRVTKSYHIERVRIGGTATKPKYGWMKSPKSPPPHPSAKKFPHFG